MRTSVREAKTEFSPQPVDRQHRLRADGEAIFHGSQREVSTVIIGCEDGDALVGFIAFREDWIDQLHVLPGAQRKGLGTALLDVAKAAFPRLHARTFQRNSRARNFYARRGFVPIKWTEGENEEKEPDVLYLWEGGGRCDGVRLFAAFKSIG